MDALRQWSLSLIVAAAAGTFVMVISPRGSMDKTVRAVVGIFVVAAICSPLAGFADSDFSFKAMSGFDFDEHDSAESLQEYAVSACRDAAEIQILATADNLGIKVNEICIDADINTDGCIIIHSIAVTIEAEYYEKQSDFSALIEDELGVPVTVYAE